MSNFLAKATKHAAAAAAAAAAAISERRRGLGRYYYPSLALSEMYKYAAGWLAE